MHLIKENNCLKDDCVSIDTNFKKVDIKESDLEDILCKNIAIITGDEKSILVVGRQVCNDEQGRCDLVALDGDGYIVVIEIKRDIGGEHANEPFETQAIRYASNFMNFTEESLLRDVFVPYLNRNQKSFELRPEWDKTASVEENAKKKLENFKKENADNFKFNRGQRIFLISSDFSPQTKSAVVWLTKNGVDISCFKITPYQYTDSEKNPVFINVEQILPLPEVSDFLVNIKRQGDEPSDKKSITRQNLPKIDVMLNDWKIVSAGDELYAKGHPDKKATLTKDGLVCIDGNEKSLQQWLRDVYGWSSVDTYACTVYNGNSQSRGKTLSQMRAEEMKSRNSPTTDQ